MKITTLLAALAVTVTPSIALAMGGCNWTHSETAMSCTPGTAWDATTSTCVATPTG